MKSILKSLAILLTVSITTSSISANPLITDPEKPQICLEVIGVAVDSNNSPINGVQVKLYKENDELEWTEITNVFYHEHSFNFKLNTNEYYTIEISKPGFVTRSVAISTKLSPTISLDKIFTYEFEVELFKEKKGVDDYYLDFPVALISYDKKRDVFDNNYAYTKHIKTRIKEALEQANNTKVNSKN